MDGAWRDAGCAQRLDRRAQFAPRVGVFVAQVDPACLGVDRLGRDQHALEETPGFPIEDPAILERAGFALVGVDHQVAWARHRHHRAPFPRDGKAGAAHAAQARFLERGEHAVRREQPAAEGGEHRPPVGPSRWRTGRRWRWRRNARAEGGGRARGGRGAEMRLGRPGRGRAARRRVAAPHAGRGQDAGPARRRGTECLEQRLPAGHGAGQAAADADRHGRRRCVAIREHVEMRVERRGFEHFDWREAQQGGQGDEVVRAQRAVTVLQRVEVLDQQVPAQRQGAERGGDGAALGRRGGPAAWTRSRRLVRGLRCRRFCCHAG
jgi:hypothetical protein